jgi:Type VI secretion system/phage-baseplate injector OB domain
MTGKAHKKEFHGKYRGTVMDNHDLEFRGRITAMVPDVLGLVPTSWATPCVPVTGLPGLQSGVYAVPPIGASVWIEFEHGDPDFPVWVGCYWGSPVEVPVLSLVGAPEAPNIVLQSVGQNVILMSGDPVAGITLSCGLPLPTLPPATPSIIISQAGIMIADGKGGVIAIADGIVTVNMGALVVTQP